MRIVQRAAPYTIRAIADEDIGPLLLKQHVGEVIRGCHSITRILNKLCGIGGLSRGERMLGFRRVIGRRMKNTLIGETKLSAMSLTNTLRELT